MPVVPTAPTISPTVSSTTQMNQFRDAINFLMAVPAANLRQTAAQTLTNNTWTSLTFTTGEDIDSDVDLVGGHSTSANTSRYTARYPGWYDLSGVVGYAANATGIRGARWAINGFAVESGGTILSTASASFSVVPAPTILQYLAISDYAELQGLQTSGGNLDTAVAVTVQSVFTPRWRRA